MLKILWVMTGVGMLGVWLPACAADGPPPHPPLETGIAPPTRIPDVAEVLPAPSGIAIESAAVPQAVRRAVVADAAKRFRISESSVVLTRAEQVTWSDGSLGCPEPGRFYTQNLVPGYRLVAKTTEGEFTYHTDSRGNVVNCAATRARPGNQLRPNPAGAADDSEPRTQPPAPVQPDR